MKTVIVGIALAVAAYVSSSAPVQPTHGVAKTYRMDTMVTAPEAIEQPTVTLSPVTITASPKHQRQTAWSCSPMRPLEQGDGFVSECGWK